MKSPLRGLRGKLLVAFVLVAAVATLTTGALTFREARVGVLQQGQDTVIKRLRHHVNGVAPGISYPPVQGDLEWAAAEVARASRHRTGVFWSRIGNCAPPPRPRTASPN